MPQAVVETVDLRTAAPVRTYQIPDSDPPVGLTTLHRDRDSGATTALVRFPSGWARPLPGHYLSAEDFVVLAGSLTIDTSVFEDGHWGYFARGHCRGDSRAGEQGAVALAWFDRAPRWVSAGHHVPERPAGHRSLVSDVPNLAIDLACPVPNPGQRLRRDPTVDVWLTAGVDGDHRLDHDAEVLSLSSWTWSRLPAGTTTCELAGPCVVRMEHRR